MRQYLRAETSSKRRSRRLRLPNDDILGSKCTCAERQVFFVMRHEARPFSLRLLDQRGRSAVDRPSSKDS
jgi:hypothetical protein